MLLTFPSKESLLRNLNETDRSEVFLIIANYKSLTNWNLIPLRRLSLFLGPNSAGKSTIYEAIEIIRRLDLIDNEDDKNLDWLTVSDDVLPTIGFSMPYILDGYLESRGMRDIYACSAGMARGGRFDDGFDGLGAFFILEGMQADRYLYESLSDVRYTLISEDMNKLEVYFDEVLASRKNQHKWLLRADENGEEHETDGGADECDFSFYKAAINTLYKPAVRFRMADNREEYNSSFYDPGEFFGLYGELDSVQDFVGIIENISGTHNFKVSDFPSFICHGDCKHNFGSAQAAVGMFLSTYTAPVLRFIDYVAGAQSGDIRQIDSNEHVESEGTEGALILSKKSSIIRRLYTRKGKHYDAKEWYKTDLIGKINRWFSEPAFLNSEYQLDVELYVKVPLDSYDDNGVIDGVFGDLSDLLKGYLYKQVVGKVYLKDSEGRNLTFTEVGAGYTQVIPLLVHLIDKEYLIFKQPELHLHPRLQSRVADCFVETIFNERTENSPKVRIVETHSEHFVLRLLRRLRESSYDEIFHSSLTLYPADVAFVYFQPTKNGTLIHHIEVLASGEFVEGWPDGFFDERDEDLWGQPSGRGR